MSESKKENFQSFQIGNLSVPSPTPPNLSTTAEKKEHLFQSPSKSVFPYLESLIEGNEIEAVAEKMGKTCEKLDEMIQTRSGRAKEEARKARLAYEHAFDLIDHLIQVKHNLHASINEDTSS